MGIEGWNEGAVNDTSAAVVILTLKSFANLPGNVVVIEIPFCVSFTVLLDSRNPAPAVERGECSFGKNTSSIESRMWNGRSALVSIIFCLCAVVFSPLFQTSLVRFIPLFRSDQRSFGREKAGFVRA